MYAIRPAPYERIVLTAKHLSFLPSDGPKLRVPWHQVSLRLTRAGKHQLLMLQHDAHRTELGKELSDPEREWVAETIGRWADSHGCSR